MFRNISSICVNLTKLAVLTFQYKLAVRKLHKMQERLP